MNPATLHAINRLVSAVVHFGQLLEASRKPKKGLRAKAHREVIEPARAAVTKMLQGYFKRQELTFMRHVGPNIKTMLAMMPPPAAAAPIEAACIRVIDWRLLTNDDLALVMAEAKKKSAAGKRFSDELVPESLYPLRFPVNLGEVTAWDTAIKTAIDGAANVAAKELETEATIGPDVAGRFLRDSSLSKLTGDIAAETTSRLRNAIADAWEAGGSYDQVVAAIKDTFQDFSEVRAGMIAQTEVNDAYNFGRLSLASEAGFEEKAWDPDGEACPICMDNVDEGYIGIDEVFGSGDDAPPAHPNCDCSISFRRSQEA